MKRIIRSAAAVPCLCVLAATLICGCGKEHVTQTTNGAVAALEVSNKIAAIAAAGDPTTLEALNDWYAEPPAGQNAAEIYGRAAQAMTADSSDSPNFLANNQTAVALLLQGATLASARYPIDLRQGAMTTLPHLAQIKKLAQLLQKETVSEARQGNTEAAAKAVVAGIRLSLSLENEPIIISRLVENASLALTTAGLAQALSLRSFTDADLVSIRDALQDADAAASLEHVLKGERCLSLSHFQMPPAELTKALAQNPNEQPRPDLTDYFKSPAFQGDINCSLDYYSNLVAIAQRPFPACLEPALKGERFDVPQEYVLSRTLLPALDKLELRAGDVAAWIRNTRTAVAVERYRLQHQGIPPDSLSVLVPGFMDEVPRDPFDGKPLRYQRKPGHGYIVYSVGRNLADDHGSTQPTGSNDRAPLDIVFAVQR